MAKELPRDGWLGKSLHEPINHELRASLANLATTFASAFMRLVVRHAGPFVLEIRTGDSHGCQLRSRMHAAARRPSRSILEQRLHAVGSEAIAAGEPFELDAEQTARDVGLIVAQQFAAGFHGAAGGQQIIDDPDA